MRPYLTKSGATCTSLLGLGPSQARGHTDPISETRLGRLRRQSYKIFINLNSTGARNRTFIGSFVPSRWATSARVRDARTKSNVCRPFSRPHAFRGTIRFFGPGVVICLVIEVAHFDLLRNSNPRPICHHKWGQSGLASPPAQPFKASDINVIFARHNDIKSTELSSVDFTFSPLAKSF